MAKRFYKLLISLIILSSVAWAAPAGAQYYYGGYGYGNPYVTSVVGLNPYFWPKSYVAAFAVSEFFGAIQEGWTMLEQGKQIENEINTRRNNLENYKSVQRYYNEGIPPFAPVAPNGKPRSPKITWQDVESIR